MISALEQPSVLDCPADVVAVPGDGCATVSWKAPADANGLSSYVVTSSPEGLVVTVGASENRATVTGLTNGRSYVFTVSARGAQGSGPPSTPSNAATPGVPGAPALVRAIPADGSATVTWVAPQVARSPIERFRVMPLPSGPPVETDAEAASAVIGGLADGRSYTFEVSAVNAFGEGPAATSDTVMIGLPGAPTDVRAKPGSGGATVSWTRPSGSLTGYVILASSGEKAEVADGGATTGPIGGLRNGQTYTFTVRARNANGWGDPSTSSNAVTPDDAPPWLFPLVCLYLLMLLAAAATYASWPAIQGLVPATIAGAPTAVAWFGALGGVLISLHGLFDHNHRDWNRRFNYWYIARPLSGAVLGLVAYLLFLATLSAAGAPAAGVQTSGLGKIVYYVIAFAVGYREECFRVLMKRLIDLFLAPGGQQPPASSRAERMAPPA